MTNYTAETYQTKRDILNFYGKLGSRSCLLSNIARSLKEDKRKSNKKL